MQQPDDQDYQTGWYPNTPQVFCLILDRFLLAADFDLEYCSGEDEICIRANIPHDLPCDQDLVHQIAVHDYHHSCNLDHSMAMISL